MAQHDYSIANDSGANVRADLNNALSAIVSQNSGTTAPTTTYAYEWWADTTNGLLKIRNAANDGWVTVGTLADANLGLATLASPSFTGTVTSAGNINMTGTGAIDVAAGTSAQRDALTASNGMFRYNTDDNAFEGYANGAWGAIGGGGGASGGGSDAVFYENGQTVTTDYSITSSTNAMSAGPITVDSGATVTVPSGSTWTIV